jgi:hypothetical protein
VRRWPFTQGGARRLRRLALPWANLFCPFGAGRFLDAWPVSAGLVVLRSSADVIRPSSRPEGANQSRSCHGRPAKMQDRALLATKREWPDASSTLFDMPLGKLFFRSPLPDVFSLPEAKLGGISFAVPERAANRNSESVVRIVSSDRHGFVGGATRWTTEWSTTLAQLRSNRFDFSLRNRLQFGRR